MTSHYITMVTSHYTTMMTSHYITTMTSHHITTMASLFKKITGSFGRYMYNASAFMYSAVSKLATTYPQLFAFAPVDFLGAVRLKILISRDGISRLLLLDQLLVVLCSTKYIHVYICTHTVTALGVRCCFALFVCLTLLASFFLLISH